MDFSVVIVTYSFQFRFQLSYSSASPALSNKKIYKRFFRVFPPESSFNSAKFDLLDSFEWKKVGTITEGHEIFTLVSSCENSLLQVNQFFRFKLKLYTQVKRFELLSQSIFIIENDLLCLSLYCCSLWLVTYRL